MRPRITSSSIRACVLFLGLHGLSSLALAQTEPRPDQPVNAQERAPGPDERIERIRHEDAGSRIDELRVGGQTRSISVQPKNGAPGYEVSPARGGEDMSDGGNGASATTGRSRWRLLSF